MESRDAGSSRSSNAPLRLPNAFDEAMGKLTSRSPPALSVRNAAPSKLPCICEPRMEFGPLERALASLSKYATSSIEGEVVVLSFQGNEGGMVCDAAEPLRTLNRVLA